MPYCTECGNKIPDGERFCRRCGTKLRTGVASPAPGQEPELEPATLPGQEPEPEPATLPGQEPEPEPAPEPEPTQEHDFPEYASERAVMPDESSSWDTPSDTKRGGRRTSNIILLVVALLCTVIIIALGCSAIGAHHGSGSGGGTAPQTNTQPTTSQTPAQPTAQSTEQPTTQQTPQPTTSQAPTQQTPQPAAQPKAQPAAQPTAQPDTAAKERAIAESREAGYAVVEGTIHVMTIPDYLAYTGQSAEPAAVAENQSRRIAFMDLDDGVKQDFDYDKPALGSEIDFAGPIDPWLSYDGKHVVIRAVTIKVSGSKIPGKDLVGAEVAYAG